MSWLSAPPPLKDNQTNCLPSVWIFFGIFSRFRDRILLTNLLFMRKLCWIRWTLLLIAHDLDAFVLVCPPLDWADSFYGPFPRIYMYITVLIPSRWKPRNGCLTCGLIPNTIPYIQIWILIIMWLSLFCETSFFYWAVKRNVVSISWEFASLTCFIVCRETFFRKNQIKFLIWCFSFLWLI